MSTSPDVFDSALTLTNVGVSTHGYTSFIFFDVVDPYNGKGPTYLQFDVIEIWRTPGALGRSAASLIGTGKSSPVAVGAQQTTDFNYWIRARNKAGQVGRFVPDVETPGLTDSTYLFQKTGTFGTDGHKWAWMIVGGFTMEGGTTRTNASTGIASVTFQRALVELHMAHADPMINDISPDNRVLAFVKNVTTTGMDIVTTNLAGGSASGLVTWRVGGLL